MSGNRKDRTIKPIFVNWFTEFRAQAGDNAYGQPHGDNRVGPTGEVLPLATRFVIAPARCKASHMANAEKSKYRL
jgi:hypothetical protein